MSKGKKRSGACPGRPQPLRGTKGKRKGARLWYVGFFLNDTPATEIYTLSLHDALPISRVGGDEQGVRPEAPPRAYDHRVLGVAADVHDRREIPVDPGALQHARDSARLELGERKVVALAELLRGERGGGARIGGEAHDL